MPSTPWIQWREWTLCKGTGGDKVCLCGNVHCAALQTGTDESKPAPATLEHGKPGGGYIFCTSNIPFKGWNQALSHGSGCLEGIPGLLKTETLPHGGAFLPAWIEGYWDGAANTFRKVGM